MYYEQTAYKNLRAYCIKEFGTEKGTTIYTGAEARVAQLRKEADYRGSKAVKNHMDKCIFPVLAYYSALLDVGFSQESAYKKVLEQTQAAARIKCAKNKKLARLPFVFLLFKACVKKVMDSNFPPQGWSLQWIKRDKTEVHFDISTCVYFDTVAKYGHPELCTVFCKNDDTSFSGYLPKIRFERSGTIGYGNSKCDFHFFKGTK